MLKTALTKAAIYGIEHRYIPDHLTRVAMRKLCVQRIRQLDQSGWSVNAFMESAKRSPIAVLTEKANEQHYEVPAELYRYCLGPRLKYSSCYWPEGVDTLAAAEEVALQETCSHADIRDGQDVLELGCGWGSLTLWLAEKYPNARITGVSNSGSQRQYIMQQAKERGFGDRVRILTDDMNRFEINETFDRVVSVEMFEHMRNHRDLLKRISTWMRPEARLFVHVFCHKKHAYWFDDVNASDWMSRYFFSGGIMPSDDLLTRYNEDLVVEEQWRWNGMHYQRTANAWVDLIDQHRAALIEVLAKIYRTDSPEVWLQRWRMLFMAGAELFGYGDGNEWYVSHYRFRHQG